MTLTDGQKAARKRARIDCHKAVRSPAGIETAWTAINLARDAAWASDFTSDIEVVDYVCAFLLEYQVQS